MREARGSRRRAAGVLLAGLLTVSACSGGSGAEVSSGFTESNPDGMHGAVLTEQYVVPDVTLTDTAGEPFSLTRDTTDEITLVFFGYTHCPDICQIVMADITSALARLEESERERVGVLFVTSDPARDDPTTLRAYLDRFDPGFEGATGHLKSIVAAADELGVPIEKGRRLPSGGYEVVHGTQIVAVDDADRSPMVWIEGTSAAHLAEDLRTWLTDGIPETSPETSPGAES